MRKAGAGKQPRKRWLSTVDIPPARPLRDGELPRMVYNAGGKSVCTEDPGEFVDAWQAGEVLPVRKFSTPIGHRYSPQQVYLDRLDVQIATETKSEAWNAHALDRDPAVTAMLAQPFWLERVGAARPGWACVDFVVARPDQTLVAVESKTRRSFENTKTRCLLAPVGRACSVLGIEYEVRCEPSDRARMLWNLLFTMGSRQPQVGPDGAAVQSEVLAACADQQTLMSLYDSVDVPQLVIRQVVWRLAWTGALCVDWEAPFSDDSPMWRHGAACRGRSAPQSRWGAACGPDLGTCRYTRAGFRR